MRNQNQNSTASNALLDTASQQPSTIDAEDLDGNFPEAVCLDGWESFEDDGSYDEWIDQREAEAIAEQEYWDWVAYGRAEYEAKREYFAKHPWESYDSPDAEVYIEI